MHTSSTRRVTPRLAGLAALAAVAALTVSAPALAASPFAGLQHSLSWCAPTS